MPTSSSTSSLWTKLKKSLFSKSTPTSQVLEALVTYMYHGTVSVPQNRLQSFLQTAEALKIKGIVDTSSNDENDHTSEPLSRLPPVPVLARAPSLPLQVSSYSR